jgi:thymidylate synthase ThyX
MPTQQTTQASIESTVAISQSRHEHNLIGPVQSGVHIYHDLHPEDMAMLQALYSRSPNSVQEHIGKVRSGDSGTFMERYYVGYGHLSIADCGSTTIFAEHVSMLSAKAIQDWPLYNGQEASTRYIDYSKQRILNPANTAAAAEIQQKWMDFYNFAKQPLQEHLKQKYPLKADEKESIYDKAIAARSFDILRGFLPAGCTTYLSWHTNLRQAHEKLALLEHHPLSEIRELALNIRQNLNKQYSHSFSHKKYPTQEEYHAKWVAQYSYFSPDNHPDFEFSHNLQLDALQAHSDLLTSRPIKTNLPNFLGMYGQCAFKFTLDFGSFRDLQRHRNGECLMPLLSTKYGFYNWYLEQLPEAVRAQAEALIKEQESAIQGLEVDEYTKQYYIPMGYAIPVTVTYKLPASVYVAELRSGKTVHPTLRLRAQQMGQALQKALPEMAMYLDLDLDDWDIRRGTQDIVKKD